MTQEQADQALRSHFAENTSLDDMGIQIQLDASGHCCELMIRVFNNPVPIILEGHRLNDIDINPLVKLIGDIFPSAVMDRSYAARSWPDLGLCAVKWESSDDWVDSLKLTPVGATNLNP